ncbi:hypothetical protein ABZ707_02975 [Streptomyces sp. NPDC006923]|uniref:hypothetical protein n=1 Tax=Streptomyces sp. NPDC006923 TaxID=3155355 RepID=UPI0034044E1B
MINRPPVEGATASPPHDAQTGDPDAAYTAAHTAFIAHVSTCYACRRRGTDCYDVGALKDRLRETQSASIAARMAAQ